jgi:hypothetical protein
MSKSDRNTVHVIPHSKGGWKVKKDGATRASKRFTKKVEAVSYGKNVACKHHRSIRVVVHKRDGTVAKKSLRGKSMLRVKAKS